LAVGLLVAVWRGDTCHTLLILVGREHEVERRDVARHSDIAIVWVDSRQALGVFT
jgi:hypothetical protein